MTKNPFRTIGKLIAVLAIVLTALIICIPQDVQAASGKTAQVTVSTAKKLKSAMKKSNVGVFSEPKYTIRKGAKIKNITLIANTEPTLVESSFNSAKRQLTLKYDNEYGYIQSYVIKLDKYGRMTSIKYAAKAMQSAYAELFAAKGLSSKIKVKATSK